MKDLTLIIAKNISQLRKNAKLTQAELAEKLGYSDKAISKWERGDGTPDVMTLVSIAELFGTTLDYIVSDNEGTPIPTPVPTKKKAHVVITSLAVLCVWFLAVLVFVCIEMAFSGSRSWLVFIGALPITFTVLIVFNSVWGKMHRNFLFMSALIWSFLTFIFFFLTTPHPWMIFLTGIPLQIGVFLWYALISPSHIEKKSRKDEVQSKS